MRSHVLSALCRHRAGQIGGALVLLIVLAALFAPWIAPFDPVALDPAKRLLPPSALHLFGTDELGRDLASRIIFGTRYFILICCATFAVSASAGVVLGLVGGIGPAWASGLIGRLNDLLLTFPYILLVLAIVAILSPSLTTAVVAVGIGGVPGYARLVRAEVLALRNTEYVEALVALGASTALVMRRAILPNITSSLVVYASFVTPLSVLAAAALSFLGLGVQPPEPEWGAMLVNARSFLRTAWWNAAAPGLSIFFAILALNLLGNALRDVLDPRTGGHS
jgi:ABC-type dipeptide/oligopeptide/nickel transport system permease subunit